MIGVILSHQISKLVVMQIGAKLSSLCRIIQDLGQTGKNLDAARHGRANQCWPSGFARSGHMGYTAPMNQKMAQSASDAADDADPGRAFFVYIVRCADGSLYTGLAADVQRRVREHNAGRGARYTRQRSPVTLVYSEVLPSRAAALQREAEIKRRGRSYKERLIWTKTSSGSVQYE